MNLGSVLCNGEEINHNQADSALLFYSFNYYRSLTVHTKRTVDSASLPSVREKREHVPTIINQITLLASGKICEGVYFILPK
jgi:hypothetical protein